MDGLDVNTSPWSLVSGRKDEARRGPRWWESMRRRLILEEIKHLQS